MVWRALLSVVLLVIALSAPVLAAEEGKGVVDGKLVNGTKGAREVGSIDVTLVTYQKGTEIDSRTVAASADGSFTFSSVATDPGYVHQAMVNYLESDYYCEPFSFRSQETRKSVEITVYETTDSDARVRVAMAHTVVYPVDGGIQVEKYYSILNDGDRAYVGSVSSALTGKKQTLEFFMPREAVDPQYLLGLMSCCIAPTQNGFADTMPVPPYGREIAYSYTIPAGSGGFTLAEKIAYPTSRYDVLVNGDGIQCRSDQLAAKGKLDIQGMPFQQFSGANFDRGQAVSVQFSGLPRKSRQGFFIWAMVALAAVGGTFGMAHLLKKRRLPAVAVESAPSATKDRLLAQLAQLDDDFSNGEISEAAYRRLRDEKKAELVQLMAGTGRKR